MGACVRKSNFLARRVGKSGAAVVARLIAFVLERTPLGRSLYALGAGREASRLCWSAGAPVCHGVSAPNVDASGLRRTGHNGATRCGVTEHRGLLLAAHLCGHFPWLDAVHPAPAERLRQPHRRLPYHVRRKGPTAKRRPELGDESIRWRSAAGRRWTIEVDARHAHWAIAAQSQPPLTIWSAAWASGVGERAK